MTSIKISALPVVTVPAGTDVFPVVQGGVTKQETVNQALSGAGGVVGPVSSTDKAITRFDGTTGKLIENSTVTLSDTGSLTFPTGQNINMPGASFINTNSVNVSAVQFKGASGSNIIVLLPGQAEAVVVTDGVAPNGYLDIDSLNQNINIRTLLNLFDDLKFNTLQYTTGTIAQSGTVITGSGTTFTSAMAGGWLIPASGTPQLFYFNNATSGWGSISQTITAGTAFTLYYFEGSVSAIATDQPSNINMFTTTRNITVGNTISRLISANQIAARSGFVADASFPSLAATPVLAPTQTASQSTTTVTGVGTTFTSAMVGQMIIYATGQQAFITAFNSTTSLTVAQSLSVTSCAFYITGTGFAGNQTTVMDGLGNFGTTNAHVSGTLTLAGQSIPTPGYLELNQNSTQAITASTITAIQYPNSVKNSFGSNLTISGTGNTTFTNASGADMFLNIAASAAEDSGSANPGHAAWLWIKTSRAIGNATTIFNFANDGSFIAQGGISVCQPLFLANGDSFQVGFISNLNITLGNSGSIQSTGQIWRTSIIIKQ